MNTTKTNPNNTLQYYNNVLTNSAYTRSSAAPFSFYPFFYIILTLMLDELHVF